MSWVDDIRVLAYRDVTAERASFDYFLRKVFRWWGATFGVEPMAAEERPLHDVLRHYFEAQIEELDDKGRMEELLLLLEEDPQGKKLKEALEDEKFLAETEAEARRQGPLRAKPAPVNNDKILPAPKAPPPQAPQAEPGMPEVNLTFGDLLAADGLEEDGVRGDPGFQLEGPRRPKLRRGPPEGR